MSTTKLLPTNLIEAIRYFSDPDICLEFVAKLRWPHGPVCLSCENTDHSFLTTRRLWKCKACKRQFSVKVGTIFEDSAIPLDKWLVSIWLIANSKNGISSHELGRAVGLTQKSAWFVLHRLRLAMETETFNKLDGEVKVDETYIGGKARNMHARVRNQRTTGSGPTDKTIVAGALQRGGHVRASVLTNTGRRTMQKHVRDNVEAGRRPLHRQARLLLRA